MRRSYPKRVINKAVGDTVDFFGWNRRTLSVPLLFILGSLIYWNLTGWAKLVDKWLEVAAFGLAPVVCLAIGVFFFNVALAPARLQAEADLRGDQLADELRDIREKQSHVDRLSDLLDEGISKIWNEQVDTQADMDALDETWSTWQQRVESELKSHFTHADVVHFSRLGVVPIVTRGGSTFDHEHDKMLREYALKESRLREIIRDYNARS